MNARVAQLWADALESGEFRQGVGQLRRADNADGEGHHYCCLGVLCELHRRETKSGGWVYRATEDSWLYMDSSGDGQTESLPSLVMEWAGLHSDSPLIPDAIPSCDCYGDEIDGQYAPELITELNDSYGWEFERFAIDIRTKFRSM